MYYLDEKALTVPAAMQHFKGLLYFTRKAEDRLWQREYPEFITPISKRKLTFQLLLRLQKITEPTMQQLIKDIVSEATPIASISMDLVPASYIEEGSAKLLQKLQQSDCAILTETSPLLAGWLESCIDNFCDMAEEMLQRICRDYESIKQQIFGGEDPGKIIDFTTDVGDLHFGGRCTVMVHTEKGRFIYRPRDCRADSLWKELAETYFSDLTKAPACVQGEGYGFAEFITARSAETSEEARRYFYNLGGLAAVFQMLGSSDLHVENFLVQGSVPVLIDIETVLTPSPRTFSDPTIFPEAELTEDDFIKDFNNSIYASGLLPTLSGTRELSMIMNTAEVNSGLPKVDGRVVTVVDGYEDSYFEGFEDIYRRCMHLREELAGFIERFGGIHIRRLIRQTNYYAVLQKKLLSPAALQDEQAREKVLQSISRFFVNHGALSGMMGIVEAERASLLKGDIPYFYSMGDGHDLISGEGNVACRDFFMNSAVENALERLSRLSDRDFAFEKGMLQQGIASALVMRDVSKAPARPKTFPIAEDAELQSQADWLFHRICDSALEAPAGRKDWLTHVQGDMLHLMDHSIFHGKAGLGIYLAAVAASTGDAAVKAKAESYAEICLSQLELLLTSYKKALRLPPIVVIPGISTGIAGYLMAFVLMGRYLGSQRALDDAEQLLQLLDKLELEGTENDIISGIAGLLEVLCRFSELRETPKGKEYIVKLADLLLQRKTMPWEDITLWQTLGSKKPLSGMGHGMAGIAAALCAAYRVTKDERYIAAAEDAWRYEHEIYSERLGTWPDLRPGASGTGAMHGYCSGAPGVGLALLSCYDLKHRFPNFDEDFERAVRHCSDTPLIMRDHLCCGNSASVAFLTEAYRVLGDTEYDKKVREMLSGMIAGKEGDFRYMPANYCPVFAPGLFYGAAGVAYQILRYLEPQAVLPILI